jgi:hypothetical protein
MTVETGVRYCNICMPDYHLRLLLRPLPLDHGQVPVSRLPGLQNCQHEPTESELPMQQLQPAAINAHLTQVPTYWSEHLG